MVLRPLFLDYAPGRTRRAKLYAHRVHTPAAIAEGSSMGDLIFLAIGLGLFMAMAGYIVSLRRL